MNPPRRRLFLIVLGIAVGAGASALSFWATKNLFVSTMVAGLGAMGGRFMAGDYRKRIIPGD